ncbi:DUF1062 domain-containing protein [Sphingobacterium puteale]|uniref:DUF1062 domain-containing protein n=1 Tax=Sphingobacterium puteale TaxID=2420510 RepID=A0A420VXN1_9SPHI|nr:DUF1062 domain-containing protein [Sphingobacterium puteale]RKO70939.1 DUF1062 domain-containing protein [Sphingobacterium puteale]
MQKKYIWAVSPNNTPLLKKSCSHCDSKQFYCSEKFRINAQKKNVDVWLIYRCVKCDSTYNLTIFSRTRPTAIDSILFNKFQNNDTEQAWKYAFSEEMRKKNKVEADLTTVSYTLQYDQISSDELLSLNERILTFEVDYPFDFQLRLSSLIRTCLNLSSRQLDQLITQEAITVAGKKLQKKHKLKDKDRIEIDFKKLKSVLCKEYQSLLTG